MWRTEIPCGVTSTSPGEINAGSGTIALEAALWARDIAPGLSASRRFGFERWACHDPAAARRAADLREAARARIRTDGPPIFASDADPAAVEVARANARAAGVPIELRRAALRDLAPLTPPGHVVTNPPYGERLAAPASLYTQLAAALSRLPGHRVALLAGTPDIEHAMQKARLPLERALTVFNGPIECRLLDYQIP